MPLRSVRGFSDQLVTLGYSGFDFGQMIENLATGRIGNNSNGRVAICTQDSVTSANNDGQKRLYSMSLVRHSRVDWR